MSCVEDGLRVVSRGFQPERQIDTSTVKQLEIDDMRHELTVNGGIPRFMTTARDNDLVPITFEQSSDGFDDDLTVVDEQDGVGHTEQCGQRRSSLKLNVGLCRTGSQRQPLVLSRRVAAKVPGF